MVLDRIFNEDCLVGMARIPDQSVDMILCDLPYGTTKNDWDAVIPFDKLWEQYRRILKKGGVVCLTAQLPFSIDVANSNREWLRYEWIWHKTAPTGFLNANRMPLKAHENVLVFYEQLGKYNPQGLKYTKHKELCHGESNNYGEYHTKKNTDVKARENPNNYGDFYDGLESGMVNFPKDVIQFKKEVTKHPTQKPVALFEYLIRTYTDEGDVVLDNCMGSGTTAVACIKTGRHYIGFETDPEYCKIIDERIKQTERKYVGQKSLGDFY